MAKKQFPATRIGCLLGEFPPADGGWQDLGYLGIMHKCDFCSYSSRYVRLVPEGRSRHRKRDPDEYWCGKCQLS